MDKQVDPVATPVVSQVRMSFQIVGDYQFMPVSEDELDECPQDLADAALEKGSGP